MTGMSLSDFLNHIYYGDEIEFRIGIKTFFIQGWNENELFVLVVDYWEKDDGTEPTHDYLWETKSKSHAEALSQFEEAKIFDGKTIYEVEQEIEVLFG